MFFDKSDIRSLDDWRHRIHESVAASRLLMAFISPAYFASPWCREEWRTWVDVEIAKHVLSDGAAPVYIVEVPWLTKTMTELEVAAEVERLAHREVDIMGARNAIEIALQMANRQLTSVMQFYDAGLTSLRHEDLRQVLRKLATDLSARSEQVTTAARSSSTIPPYNRRFVGRLSELSQLREHMHRGRVVGIHGLGGIGKTELALTYAHAFAGLYPGGRFLVPCEGQRDLRQAALALDEVFHDQIIDEQRKTLATHFSAIRNGLRERSSELGPVLLVLDNISDGELLRPEQLDEFRMLGQNVHLLVTARINPQKATRYDDQYWVTLGELSLTDSVRLLQKFRIARSSSEEAAASAIGRRLGGFALCVEVTGAYLSQHSEITYCDFLEIMGLDDLERIDQVATESDVLTRRHNNEKRLRAILAPTFVTLSAETKTMLRFAALLAPDQVVLPWLRRLVQSRGSRVENSETWQRLVDQLVSLALLTRPSDESSSEQPRVVRCHRLIQEYVRREIPAEELRADQKVLEELAWERASRVDLRMRWDSDRWEVEPLDALARLWDETQVPAASRLMRSVALRWHDLADWARAEPLFRRALAIDEEKLGPENPQIGQDLNDLGILLNETNRWREAEPLLRRAIAIYEITNDPRLSNVLDALAVICKQTDRLAEAEQLCRRAVAIDRDNKTPTEVDMAVRLNNLAAILVEKGQANDAEALYWMALQIDEEQLPPNHPHLALRLRNLASVIAESGRAAEAEPLARRALEIDERNYDGDHPSVACDLRILSGILGGLNRASESEPLLRRSLEIEEKSNGPNHPDVANSLNNLACLLDESGRSTEAVPLFRRALAIAEQSYGPDHTSVSEALNNLGSALYLSREYAEAEPLMRRALTILFQKMKATGVEPRRMEITFMNYVNLLGAMGFTKRQRDQRMIELERPYDVFR